MLWSCAGGAHQESFGGGGGGWVEGGGGVFEGPLPRREVLRRLSTLPQWAHSAACLQNRLGLAGGLARHNLSLRFSLIWA